MRPEDVGRGAVAPPDRHALLRTIEALEGQRSTLGDNAVELAIAPLRARLAEAEAGAGVRWPVAPRAAERKIVTVLFVDVAGFTGMSEAIGSEATLDTVNSLFDRLVPEIERFGGVVDKFIGDEIMAVFGAPRTDERHAEHALRAALAMFAALDDYNRDRELSLALHAGVNTGEVVAGAVGSTGRHDYSVTGDTVNVAARLASAASRGEIVVGPSTYRHTLRLFEFAPLEPIMLKGKSRPLAAHRLVELAPAREAQADGLQLPFSGRDAELAQLVALFDTASPRGAVFVRGKPGLGKSRLVGELRDRLSGQARWLDASGLDFRSDLSHGVVSELLDGIVGVSDSARGDDAAHAYVDYVNGVEGERFLRALPYLLRLRGLPLAPDDDAALSALGADALRERTGQAVADLLAAAIGGQPAVVCIEDLHWADPSSVALLRSLAERPGLGHVLFVLTTRPDHSPASSWIDAVAAGDDRRRIVDLAPLSEHDSRALLDHAFASGSTPSLVDEIGSKAQGNPLYLASFLRSLIDSGLATLTDGRVAVDAPVATVAIPDTLQAVVGSQIDRLPTLGKDVLHWAAILGNAFAPADVERMARADKGGEGVEAMLEWLCERQLLETGGERGMRFVHALVRDVAYDQMLERERRRLHGVAAGIVTEQMAAVDQPSEADVAWLAWHLERAGDHPAASLRYGQAAALARSSHAHAEEVRYLDSAIRLAIPRDGRRIADLQECAGDALQILGRYLDAQERYERVVAAPEAATGLAMARLHRKIARTWTPRFGADEANRALGEARRWLADAAVDRSDAWWREHFAVESFAMYALYMQARADACAEIARSLEPEVDAHANLTERAEFHRGVALFKLRQQRYRPDRETVEVARLAGQEARDSGVTAELCLTIFGLPFTQLWGGAIEEAERGMRQVLDDTVRLGDAERNLLCLVYLAVASRQLGNVDSAEAFANAAIVRARANRSPHYEAVSQGTLAWVAWRRGEGALADERVQLAQKSIIPMYPFKWLYAAVGLARAVERGDAEAAQPMIARMLEPSHQRLDTDVEAVFEAAQQACDLVSAQAAVDVCRKVRYL